MSNEFNIPSKAGKPHERHYTCPRRGTLPKALGSLASWCVSNGRVKWFNTQTICDDESFDLSDVGLLEFMNEKLWHKFVTAIPNKFLTRQMFLIDDAFSTM